jgi:hypothetical protein
MRVFLELFAIEPCRRLEDVVPGVVRVPVCPVIFAESSGLSRADLVHHSSTSERSPSARISSILAFRSFIRNAVCKIDQGEVNVVRVTQAKEKAGKQL